MLAGGCRETGRAVRVPRIDAKLYWFPISHPSHAARAMLERKGIDYKLVHVLPGNQKIHLRAAGFKGGTVPALKLDGRRIQGSTDIGHTLDELQPEPALYPTDPEERRRAEEVEHWGDAEFQMVPRRILRYALTRDAGLRKWLAEADGTMPAPGVAARLTGPVSWYYAWSVKGNEDHARRNVAQLPALLDRVDELIEERVIGRGTPPAVTLQIMCTVRSLMSFADFQEQVEARSFAPLARELFPYWPSDVVPPFVDRLGLR
jgi:glutathione S-transferase